MTYATNNYPPVTTNKLTKEQRDIATNNLMQHHLPMIKAFNSPTGSYFYPKVPSLKNGVRVIGLFQSEMAETKEVFIELIYLSYQPYDPQNRTLYRYRKNPNYQEEFEVDGQRYLIPVDELEVVTPAKAVTPAPRTFSRAAQVAPQAAVPAKKTEFDFPTGDLEDENFSALTIRDLAALLLQKPVSNKEWLNLIINPGSSN